MEKNKGKFINGFLGVGYDKMIEELMDKQFYPTRMATIREAVRALHQKVFPAYVYNKKSGDISPLSDEDKIKASLSRQELKAKIKLETKLERERKNAERFYKPRFEDINGIPHVRWTVYVKTGKGAVTQYDQMKAVEDIVDYNIETQFNGGTREEIIDIIEGRTATNTTN